MNHGTPGNRISVLMPTYNQGAYIGRAIRSVLAQSHQAWELIVVDDGSTDDTSSIVAQFRLDPRISDRRLQTNSGLGACLNAGLAAASAPIVGYLPSDDIYYPEHLAALLEVIDQDVVLAWSGVKHHDGELGRGKVALGPPPGFPLQLVQVAHRLTEDRWTERAELETDDLERLFWSAMRRRGRTAGTGAVTCEWTDHPRQRHKAIRESYGGGLNVFRSRYRVASPLRFQSTDGSFIDEVQLYQRFRDRPPTPPAPDGLKILLVGELGHNPERILALEERGHRLYGLWTQDGLRSCTVGPLPFGHVTDLPPDGWRDAVRGLRPDVIYAMLNYLAVPFAHTVLDAGLGVPFVWHFKEGPQRCLARGTWAQLADLCTRSQAQLYSSPEERDWLELALPGNGHTRSTAVLDGDLPKREWFSGTPKPKLSDRDGEAHTVVLGRPLGLTPAIVAGLAKRGVHIHIYGLVRGVGLTGEWTSWLEEARELAPRHVHLHPHVAQDGWVPELSQYDAGWLHHSTSHNQGSLLRAAWDDLNYPTRIPALMAAGVPLLQQESPGCVVATQNLVRQLGVGILYQTLDDLCDQVQDADVLRERREAISTHRERFTFDHHVKSLEELLQSVVG